MTFVLFFFHNFFRRLALQFKLIFVSIRRKCSLSFPYWLIGDCGNTNFPLFFLFVNFPFSLSAYIHSRTYNLITHYSYVCSREIISCAYAWLFFCLLCEKFTSFLFMYIFNTLYHHQCECFKILVSFYPPILCFYSSSFF